MDFALLGPLRMLHDGADVPLGRPRHQALLAVLLAHRGSSVSYDRLVLDLWGDTASSNAVPMLHVRMSQLRKCLATSGIDAHKVLVTTRSGYVLNVPPSAVDAHRFEDLVASARTAASRGRHQAAGTLAREGLGLWRGRPFGDWADAPFAQPVTAKLEALRLDAVELRIEGDLALGEHEAVVPDLATLTREHPLRERLWYQLMLARYRAGRQSEALDTFRRAREALLDQLGVEPGEELSALHTAILRQDQSLLRARSVITAGSEDGREQPVSRQVLRGEPPAALTPFFGRERELEQIATELARHRLVTLVGAGGSGKSRLALEAAARMRAASARAVVWVELAEASAGPGTREEVTDAVALRLGLLAAPPLTSLDIVVRALRHSGALLVLDNGDRRLADVAQASATLLARVEDLRILVTSRQRLGIGAEQVIGVSGLPVPDLVREGAPAAVEAAAVRLFTDRAARSGDAFQLTGANLPDVVAVCERVDGLPLAVELAAANTRSLAVATIAAHLAERPDGLRTRGALASARHRTLQEVIAWSHDALDPAEQRLLAYLSVFADGFDLAAAEAVCAGPRTGFDKHEVLDVLSGLVEKSMVSVEVTEKGHYRYRMLRMIRAFASRELRRRGERHTLICARHLTHFADLTESAGEALRSGASPAWLRRLETEYANIRAALDRSLQTRDAMSALRMAAALVQFWELHGRYAEGRRYVSDILAICDDETPAALRAYALAGAACLATIQGDLAGAEDACDEAAALFDHLGDIEGRTYVLVSRGLAAVTAQDLDRAERLLRTATELAAELSHGWLQQWALIFDIMLALSRVLGERSTSPRPLPSALSAVPTAHDPKSIAWYGVVRAGAELEVGRPARATAYLEESCRLFAEMDAVWGLSVTLLAVSRTASQAGEHTRASTLLGASESLRRSVEADCWPVFAAWRREVEVEGRRALGTERFLHVRATGEGMPRSAALDLALRGRPAGTAPRGTADAAWSATG
ncbi:BTAD domain-containing putative transcriptional regulator [Streptomyces sp. BK79]|uniref:BTAD domain-containing putative transcriptional regulator n=1 Tax=Streptomyces sp. BK79 TaxID=3350097 RepID=UPI00376F8406